MRLGKRVLLPAISALCISAQSARAATSDGQVWTGFNVSADLGSKFRISQEIVARFSDRRNGLYEIESNTLLGYRLNKKVTLWGGYTHDPQYDAGRFTVMEHRAREQVTFDDVAKVGHGTVSARLRLEQRWREGVDGTAWRVRPFAKYTLPVAKGRKTALVLSHESFLNTNRTAFQRSRGLDRMRNFVGVSTPLIANIALEAGYLNQHGFVRSGPDTQDHVATATLGLSL